MLKTFKLGHRETKAHIQTEKYANGSTALVAIRGDQVIAEFSLPSQNLPVSQFPFVSGQDTLASLIEAQIIKLTNKVIGRFPIVEICGETCNLAQ